MTAIPSKSRRAGVARQAARAAQAALLALLLAACSGPDETELVASAKSYLAKKDPKAAVIQLKNALEKNPSSAQVRFLLGQALLDSGDPAGAEVEIARAIELKFPPAQAVPLRARALLAKGDARKVTDEYGSTDLGDPLMDIELQTSLGMAYAARGMMDEARAAVGKALAISPHYAPAVVLGARLTASAGDIDGALAALDALLGQAPDSVDAILFKADLLRAAKGDNAGALALYRKALAVRADLPDAHAAVIGLALAERDIAGAKKQYAELAKLRPNQPATQMLDAQVAFAEGDLKRARDVLQGVLRLAPENPRVLALAGAAELQLGALSQAESLLTRAAQLAPGSVDIRRLLAETYLRTRQPTRALAALKPILEMKAPPPRALALAAQAHLLEGDAKTAEALFKRAAQLKPDDARLNAAVALSKVSRGNADAAFGELERLAAGDDGRAVDMALISARLQRREFDGALKAIEALERKQPDSPVPSHLRGRVHAMKQDVAAARKAFEQALAKDPKYLPAVGALAALDLRQNDAAAAEQRFAALLKADPKNVNAMLALAELKQRIAAPAADVAKAYADAVAAAPGDAMPRMAQIDYLTHQRDQKAALTAAQAAVEAVQNNADLLDRLARLQLATGDQQQALSTYGKIVALRPESALGYLGQAAVRLQAKEPDAAMRDVKRALEKQPDALAAQRMAITLSLQQGKVQDAIGFARQMQQRRPDHAIGFVAEGEIEASQKKWDAALAALRKGLGKQDGGAAALRLHTTLLLAQRPAEAAKFAETWAKEHPKDAAFVFYLADQALQSNNLALAETRYLEVVKLQPANALALNNVAWLQMRQSKPGARQYAERAYQQAPRQPAIVDTYAMVLAAAREFPKAIELQKQALALSGDAPGFRMNLARIYLDSGDKKAARGELQKLAQLGEAYPAQAEVARLLKLTEGS